MNAPISFEIAKLLKEKGFDLNHEYMVFTFSETEKYPEGELFLKPTIAEVVMWLYEKHGIWIEVVKPVRQKLFRFNVDNKDDINEFTSVVCFNSPTEAYEAAIIYTLNNLI